MNMCKYDQGEPYLPRTEMSFCNFSHICAIYENQLKTRMFCSKRIGPFLWQVKRLNQSSVTEDKQGVALQVMVDKHGWRTG